MKVVLFCLVMGLGASLLPLSGSALALNEILEAYTSNDLGSPQISFSLEQTPYLFSAFSFTNPAPQIKSAWLSPSKASYSFTITDNGSYRDLNTESGKILATLLNWDDKREYGAWSWTAKAANGDSDGALLDGQFQVARDVAHTPEPVSSTLFLLGVSALALKRSRKPANS
jgi:hypothetical protein